MWFPQRLAAHWYLGRFATGVLVYGVLMFCGALAICEATGWYGHSWMYHWRRSRRKRAPGAHCSVTKLRKQYGLFWGSGLLAFWKSNVHGGVAIG